MLKQVGRRMFMGVLVGVVLSGAGIGSGVAADTTPTPKMESPKGPRRSSKRNSGDIEIKYPDVGACGEFYQAGEISSATGRFFTASFLVLLIQGGDPTTKKIRSKGYLWTGRSWSYRQGGVQ